MRTTVVSSVLAVCVAAALGPAGRAQEPEITIGGLATLEGPFAMAGKDGFRGMELALAEHNYRAGGKAIRLVKGASDANPHAAVSAARKLVEQDRVSVLIGPLWGSEGVAVKTYAKTQPGTTFVNGTSAAQDTTLRDPAPNFYRFTADAAQWQAGLGEYAYKEKGYRTIALVAEDHAFAYSQVMGFMIGYCAAGGAVVQKVWVPPGTGDYASVVARLRDGIDAVYLVLAPADAIGFLTQYQQAGSGKPMIGGSMTLDRTVLGTSGRLRDSLIGTPSAGPIADAWDDPKWKAFVDAYRKKFPDGLASPSLFAHGYYVGTKAVLLALDQVKGDLSDGQRKLREALQRLELESPTGMISLDKNRQAVADIFVTEVAADAGGRLYNRVVRVVPQVNQSLGEDPQKFLWRGPASRTNPECR